jgi:predicted ATPase
MCFKKKISNKGKIIYVFIEKTDTKSKINKIIVGHCIIFSDFFEKVMSYEPQT